jgi:ribosomal protein L32
MEKSRYSQKTSKERKVMRRKEGKKTMFSLVRVRN